MSTVSPAALEEKPKGPRPVRLTTADAAARHSTWAGRAADGSLVALFLILTCLLGAFPLKDADIYWHLRTGDLIRETGKVPQTDIYTFTREGTPWIDLHWLFQVGISWLHERGGVVALNVAKCAITCLAMLILITARKVEWPIAVMILAWLPALLVLSGRIYVRPETLTLLYLSIFLAVIVRWDRFPGLAFLLPVVQVAWVNSHSLFVLGPIILGFALIDAALRFGIFNPERRRWWKIVLAASMATGLACLVNPYGIKGVLFPVEIAGTMANPIFSRNVAELTSVPAFISKNGLGNLPLQLQLLAMLVGGLSFLLPLAWQVAVWLRRAGRPMRPERQTAPWLQAPNGRRARRNAAGRQRGVSRAAMAGLWCRRSRPPLGSSSAHFACCSTSPSAS